MPTADFWDWNYTVIPAELCDKAVKSQFNGSH